MNTQEIAAVLGKLAVTQYVKPDEDTIKAWQDALDEGMTLTFAVKFIGDWQGRNDDTNARLLPGHLNKGWRDARAVYKARRDVALQRELLESHCGKRDCPCTHGSGCFKGWLDDENDTHTVRPCPVCRRTLVDALTVLPPPGQRTDVDFATLRNHAKSDHYEQA